MKVHPALEVVGAPAKLLKIYFPEASIALSATGDTGVESYETSIAWADPDDHDVTFDVELKTYLFATLWSTGYSSYAVTKGAGASKTLQFDFVDAAGLSLGYFDFGTLAYNASVQIAITALGAEAAMSELRPNGIKMSGLYTAPGVSGSTLSGELVIDSPTYLMLTTTIEGF